MSLAARKVIILPLAEERRRIDLVGDGITRERILWRRLPVLDGGWELELCGHRWRVRAVVQCGGGGDADGRAVSCFVTLLGAVRALPSCRSKAAAPPSGA